MSMLFYFTILKHYFINIPYHFTISLHRKTLFLLKYYFLTHSLLFLPPNRSASFSWAFQQPFLFLPPSTDSTHTHYTPINLSKPITTPTHTNTYINPATKPHTNTTQQQSHTQTQPSNKAKPHTQTQTHSKTGPPIKNPGQPTDPHRRSTNPRRRFETQATDQKPEQIHSKKVITGATSATTQPRPRPTSAADPRPTTPFSRRSMTNDPLHPSSPIHDHDPTTPNHNPQLTTTPIHNHHWPTTTPTHNPQRTQPRPTTPFKLRA